MEERKGKELENKVAKMSRSNSQEKKIDENPTPNEKQVDFKDIKDLHYKALDDLVNINSLFTVAVFVGLAYANRGQQSLENRVECQAGTGVGKMLVVYEVLAFACFIFSSLVAKVIKLLLHVEETKIWGISFKFIRPGLDLKDIMLTLAASASACGIVLLTLSVVNIVQIRVGMVSCGTWETRVAVLGLCSIVLVALVIYVVSMGIAIRASIKSDKKNGEQLPC